MTWEEMRVHVIVRDLIGPTGRWLGPNGDQTEGWPRYWYNAVCLACGERWGDNHWPNGPHAAADEVVALNGGR